MDSVNMVNSPAIRGGIKKNKLVFFRKTPKGGRGGLAQSEISLSEKTETFLDFFFKGGGGSHIFQKGVIIKSWGFLDIFAKRGGLTQSIGIFS